MLASLKHSGAASTPGLERSPMTIFYPQPEPVNAAFRRRLRVRTAICLLRAGLRAMHRAIVAAKLRRAEREWLLHDCAKENPLLPQAPLVLGDKWDF
jgi:hypothetical protein